MPKIHSPKLQIAILGLTLVVLVILSVFLARPRLVEELSGWISSIGRGRAVAGQYVVAIVDSQYENNGFVIPTISNNQPSITSLAPAQIHHQIAVLDWRAYVLDKFFESKKSPLAGQGRTFIHYCDKYGAPADCTTIPAIAFAETNYCRYSGSADIFNCWGFGGSGSNRYKFSSFDEAINLITERLTRTYGNDFLSKPSIAANTYCGGDCRIWARAVEYARNDLNQFSLSLGFPRLRK